MHIDTMSYSVGSENYLYRVLFQPNNTKPRNLCEVMIRETLHFDIGAIVHVNKGSSLYKA